MTDEEIIKELRLFIENLDGIHSTIVSDHILNLLEELNGKLPEDKKDLLGVIDEFLNLEAEEKTLFQIGRRAGLFRSVADLQATPYRARAEQILNRIKAETQSDVQEVVNSLLERYI